MKIGDLVRIIDSDDVNQNRLGIVTYLINEAEVEVWCESEPWIYTAIQLEVCNEVS